MDFVELSKQRAVSGMEFFLRNFSYVPDDKLHWTPTPTSKSAIRIAAHTALYAGRFAKMIMARQLPQPENLDEWVAANNAEEVAITTREEMERVFRQGTADVLAALDTLTEEEVESTLQSGQGWSMPMTQLIGLPGWHATLHAGQIDYLQTCWDDQRVYVE
ncbi:MAG TPA: DinB family protein [Fimbriimonadaceae bacterium]|nr:DinB family protein [Fimbriimonadaceae bacterium]